MLLLRLTILGMLMMALPVRAAGSDPDADSETAALIDELDDDEFARREAAVQALARLGRKAIDPITRAAVGTSPEVTSRSVRLLEQLMESDDPQTIDQADAALAALSQSDDPQAAALAGAALVRKALIREQRAVEKIQALGGQVQVGPQVRPNGQPLPGLSFEEARQPRPRNILIGRDWKGGTEGLDHFRRLSHLTYLQIYVEQGASVSVTQVQSLASVLPGLTVHERGPYLGVAGVSNGQTGCIIGEVRPGGPAEKAGLQARDHVLALENQPIDRFEELVDGLKAHAIGDTVTISVQRFDPELRQPRTIDVEVKLEAWSLPSTATPEPSP